MFCNKQARKLQATLVRNYHRLTHLLTGVKCRATSVAKKDDSCRVAKCNIICFQESPGIFADQETGCQVSNKPDDRHIITLLAGVPLLPAWRPCRLVLLPKPDSLQPAVLCVWLVRYFFIKPSKTFDKSDKAGGAPDQPLKELKTLGKFSCPALGQS